MNVNRRTGGERVFDVLNVLLMAVLAAVTVFPFWNQLVTSLSGGSGAYSAGVLLVPRKFSLGAYTLIFRYPFIWVGFRNSLLRMAVGTLVSICCTAITAYPLSKARLPFRWPVTALILFTMIFNGGLIPNYLLMKRLRLMNSFAALIIPNVVSAWNVLIMRNYFMSLPASIEESAKIEGAGHWRILVSVVVPLSAPVIATVALWIAVYYWNEWFTAYIYVSDPAKAVLQLVLRKIIIENDLNDIKNVIRLMMQRALNEFSGRQLQAAVIMAAVIPMLMIYPFIQKYFVRGILVGSIKG